jgi:predicted short-subunit dehydrogenase-like oxidoreductase (DUF2520 family)
VSERVFILGAGKVGTALARAFRAAGVEVVGLHGRKAQTAPDAITSGPIPPFFAGATVVLVTVRDAQLEEVLAGLASASPAKGTVVLHTSGAAEPAALAALRAQGHPCGTFHPLLAFTDPARAAASIGGAWFGIDGDPRARETSRTLAAALGARTLEIPAGEKVRYHAAAVFVSNFPALLMASGEKLLTTIGLLPDDARAALMPLFAAAAENVKAKPSVQALTGPIVRGDVETVRRHVAALAADPEMRALYAALSRAAVELARKAGTDPARLAEISTLLPK